MDTTPMITEDLIRYLKKLFPKQNIHPESSMQEIYYNAGIDRVITTLETLMTKQEKRK